MNSNCQKTLKRYLESESIRGNLSVSFPLGAVSWMDPTSSLLLSSVTMAIPKYKLGPWWGERSHPPPVAGKEILPQLGGSAGLAPRLREGLM